MNEIKQAESEAIGNLDYVLTRPEVDALKASLVATRQTAVQPRSPGEIWDDYERNAAQLLAILAEVLGGHHDPAARGFLPAEIVERVEAMTLDLSMLKASLRGYQSFGARYALVQQRTILGDEMGLGKTVEALAALCHLRVGGKDTALVVCPASVVANWRAEVQRHTRLTSHMIHGSSRDWALRSWHRQGGIGITTFDALRRLDPAQLPVERELAMLIVDEAHYVKNPSTKRSQAVAEWGRKAERVLFLTGTPMENRVEDFQALIAHLQPDVARRVDATAALAGPHAFQTAVAPVYLRRNQADVLDELPEMIQSLDWNEATGADETAYRAAVAQGSFMAMRRAAYESAGVTDLSTARDINTSAKLARLVDIAEEASEEGLKIVVFSFFRDVLGIATRALGIALPGAVYGPLTGSTSASDRQRLVDSLTTHSGGAALVSQIEAGGVGLNIQAASVVILCEPQWKPTVEAQAIARCHRMGQVRRVQVHRLLLEDTVDQRMLEVLAGKQHLIDQFVGESAVKDASPAAVDISDLADVERVVDEAQSEAAIIEWERRRMGIRQNDVPAPTTTWAPPTPGSAHGGGGLMLTDGNEWREVPRLPSPEA
ncbi:MAG: DEAD/DEAH box helicase [Ilumatobacteraceae bacterium]